MNGKQFNDSGLHLKGVTTTEYTEYTEGASGWRQLSVYSVYSVVYCPAWLDHG